MLPSPDLPTLPIAHEDGPSLLFGVHGFVLMLDDFSLNELFVVRPSIAHTVAFRDLVRLWGCAA